MLLYTYQDCYTMEAFYEDLMPNFIYLKDNDTDEEYRYYYDVDSLRLRNFMRLLKIDLA